MFVCPGATNTRCDSALGEIVGGIAKAGSTTRVDFNAVLLATLTEFKPKLIREDNRHAKCYKKKSTTCGWGNNNLSNLEELLNDMLSDVVGALPAIIAAVVIVIIGYLVGKFVGRAVNKAIEKMGIEKSFDETDTGKTFRSAGWDMSSFIGGITTAFILVISVIIAIQILNIGGVIGEFLVDLAGYLPRLLGGIVIIVVGSVLVGFLSSLVGNTLKPIFPKAKVEIADMLKSLLQIGLIAVIILIALDLMLLSGELIYPLILGFVIIGAGIALTDGLIKSITDDHKEFVPVAGYAKFVLYSIFLIIGAGAIFSTFEGVTNIVANVSWAFAIAMGILLIPVIYNLAKTMSKETT
ncbi:MAG: hypothetical protein CW691_00380 [Candidatus Bathyarchaeum sp.]|nr:MAG: hypothetical protein CW691_00380 [Candidatus Bathyarchaeum sp.]